MRVGNCRCVTQPGRLIFDFWNFILDDWFEYCRVWPGDSIGRRRPPSLSFFFLRWPVYHNKPKCEKSLHCFCKKKDKIFESFVFPFNRLDVSVCVQISPYDGDLAFRRVEGVMHSAVKENSGIQLEPYQVFMAIEKSVFEFSVRNMFNDV